MYPQILLPSFFCFISSFISSIFNFFSILLMNLCCCIWSSFFLISASFFSSRSSRHPFNQSINSWYLSVFYFLMLTDSPTISYSTLLSIIISWTLYFLSSIVSNCCSIYLTCFCTSLSLFLACIFVLSFSLCSSVLN